MSLFDRFFGKKSSPPDAFEPGGQLVANPAIENPLSLQVLFSGPLYLSTSQLTALVRLFHPIMARAQCEVDPDTSSQGTPLGLIGWGRHVIKVVGFNSPMPRDAVESCVQPAHYAQEDKAAARAHQSHIILYYGGYEEDAVEQYIALSAVASSLTSLGAVAVLNSGAMTSVPATFLTELAAGPDFDALRHTPLLYFYCGFVKYEIEDTPGVWMRTFGCHYLGLPDLAIHRDSHNKGEETFEMFNNILAYLRSSGARFEVGHTMQVGEDSHLKLRAPTEAEPFLESDGELFVCEMIRGDQINKPD